MAFTRLQKKAEDARKQQQESPSETPSPSRDTDSTGYGSRDIPSTPVDQMLGTPALPPAPQKAKKLRFDDQTITPVPFILPPDTRPTLPNLKPMFLKGLQYSIVPVGLAIIGAMAAYLSGAALLYIGASAFFGFACARAFQTLNAFIANRHFERAKIEGLINREGTALEFINVTVLKKVLDDQNIIIAGQKGEQSWKEYIKDCVRLPRTFIPFSSASKYYHAGRAMESNQFRKNVLGTMSTDSNSQNDTPLSNKPQ